MCYTYDNLNRVTNRTIKNLSDDTVVSSENFAYDSAGNITSAPESAYQYDANNRLTAYNGQSISYDADGNMQNAFIDCEEYGFVFDSANRLLKAKGQEYTYNAEDVRIRNKCSNYTDTYVYDTNCKLSRMLIRNTNGGIAKFVYGVGLIGEESYNTYKVYHFDSRGSTVALTDMTGAVIDTYSYNTYGKITYRTYSNDTVLLYNGRDGVVFDQNGLYYMRARYYSPKFRRFVNADIIPGEISDSTSLNRYSYVNGNPVSYVDPFGLSAEEKGKVYIYSSPKTPSDIPYDILMQILAVSEGNYKYYYSDDYEHEATVEENDGSIIYRFSHNHDGLFGDTITTTKYYFEVKKASEWQSKLEYERTNIFDDSILKDITGFIGEFGVPNAELPNRANFTIGIIELMNEYGGEIIGDSIEHKTKMSKYLYEKVVGKNPDQNVAILKSVHTTVLEKPLWADEFEIDKEYKYNFY